MKTENLDKLSILIALVIVVLTVSLMSLTSKVEKAQNAESSVDAGAFTEAESALIMQLDSVMRVLLVTNKADSLVLRKKSVELNQSELALPAFKSLAEKMLRTVQAPENDGVGIAAPQVGINRRVIVVCRVDKPGEPFEVYPNAKLDSLYGPITHGPEGCLSIPGLRGNVDRYSSVIVSYNDPVTLQQCKDTVSGYSAIIFQHECDHLDGILYTDKADSLRVVAE